MAESSFLGCVQKYTAWALAAAKKVSFIVYCRIFRQTGRQEAANSAGFLCRMALMHRMQVLLLLHHD